MPAVCQCRHGADTHQHYRDGTDCGHCGADRCPAYRPANRVIAWLRARLTRRRR